jgi:Phage capsid family
VTNVDVDLAALVAAVPGIAVNGSASWVMTSATATKLSLLRGTGGAAAYPDIGPGGGTLLQLPVVISSAAQPSNAASRFIALLSPADIAFARGGIELGVSHEAEIQLETAPISPPAVYDSTKVNRSLWSENLVAFKAVRTAGWFARPSSQAYSIVGY